MHSIKKVRCLWGCYNSILVSWHCDIHATHITSHVLHAHPLIFHTPIWRRLQNWKSLNVVGWRYESISPNTSCALFLFAIVSDLLVFKIEDEGRMVKHFTFFVYDWDDAQTFYQMVHMPWLWWIPMFSIGSCEQEHYVE